MAFTGSWGQWYEEAEHPRGRGGKWRTKGYRQQGGGKARVATAAANKPSKAKAAYGEHSDERPGVRAYCGGMNSWEMNAALRLGITSGAPREIRESIKNLRREIEASPPLSKDVVAYRVVGSTFADKLNPGAAYTEKGFTSVTLDSSKLGKYKDRLEGLGSGTGAPRVMQITLPKGLKALKVKGSSEQELIVQTGTRFKVTGRDKNTLRLKTEEGRGRGRAGRPADEGGRRDAGIEERFGFKVPEGQEGQWTTERTKLSSNVYLPRREIKRDGQAFVEVWHGTVARNWSRIKREGLRVGQGTGLHRDLTAEEQRRVTLTYGKEPIVYLATVRDVAEQYANALAEREGDRPLLVRLEVPKVDFEENFYPESFSRGVGVGGVYAQVDLAPDWVKEQLPVTSELAARTLDRGRGRGRGRGRPSDEPADEGAGAGVEQGRPNTFVERWKKFAERDLSEADVTEPYDIWVEDRPSDALLSEATEAAAALGAKDGVEHGSLVEADRTSSTRVTIHPGGRHHVYLQSKNVPDGSWRFVHNHPSANPPSMGDLSWLNATPSVKSVGVVDATGGIFSVSLPRRKGEDDRGGWDHPAFRKLLDYVDDKMAFDDEGDIRVQGDLFIDNESDLIEFPAVASFFKIHARNRALAEAGLIEYRHELSETQKAWLRVYRTTFDRYDKIAPRRLRESRREFGRLPRWIEGRRRRSEEAA